MKLVGFQHVLLDSAVLMIMKLRVNLFNIANKDQCSSAVLSIDFMTSFCIQCIYGLLDYLLRLVCEAVTVFRRGL